MSTAPAATGATVAPAGDAAPATKSTDQPAKITRVPDDVRRRILSGGRMPPEDAAAAKEKADKLAAEKKSADEKAAKEKTDKETADQKKQSDEAAAKKKKKEAPALPDLKSPPPGPGIDPKDLAQTVRDMLPEIQREQRADPQKRTFSPEVEQELVLARFAEQHTPEKYKGMAEKVESFYVAQDQLLAEKAKELGGQRSHEFKNYLESDEYRDWVSRSQPRYERGDKQKLTEAAIAARAEGEAMRKLAPQIDELKKKTLEVEHAANIRQQVQQSYVHILANPPDDPDPALEGFSKDPMKFGEEHPEEARVIATEAQTFGNLIETVHRVDVGLIDPKADKAELKWIRTFMNRQNAEMAKKNPNGLQMPDGHILVDAVTYDKHQLHKDPRYRTWSATEMAGMIALEGNAQVLARLRARRDGVATSVYAKPPALPVLGESGQEKKEPDTKKSPEADVSRSPGGRKENKEKKSLAKQYA